jgi:hypothetical protein
MILTLTITQSLAGKEISESFKIELDNMKHNPELQILNKIQDLKESVMKQCDISVGELFKIIINE